MAFDSAKPLSKEELIILQYGFRAGYIKAIDDVIEKVEYYSYIGEGNPLSPEIIKDDLEAMKK